MASAGALLAAPGLSAGLQHRAFAPEDCVETAHRPDGFRAPQGRPPRKWMAMAIVTRPTISATEFGTMSAALPIAAP